MSQKKLLPASCKSGIYQGFGSAFIWSGSGSSIWGWRPIQIQGFNDQKLKKKNYSWKKIPNPYPLARLNPDPDPKPWTINRVAMVSHLSLFLLPVSLKVGVVAGFFALLFGLLDIFLCFAETKELQH